MWRGSSDDEANLGSLICPVLGSVHDRGGDVQSYGCPTASPSASGITLLWIRKVCRPLKIEERNH